jgi:hypothetical protein
MSLLLEQVSLGIDYLREEPGHKDLVLLSANFSDPRYVKHAVEDLTRRANRAGVTVHVLFPGSRPQPEQQPVLDIQGRPMQADMPDQNPSYVRGKYLLSMLARIAQDTGGMFFIHPAVDRPYRDPRIILTPAERMGIPTVEENQDGARYFARSWQSILSDFGVYTLGYRPAALASGFHKITVQLRRPGLTAHTRTGYYETPEQAAEAVKSGSEPVSAALDAPLHGSLIPISAQAFESAQQRSDGRVRTVVRVVLSIDPDYIAWEERGGRKRAMLQSAAVAYGLEHQVVSQAAKTCELDAPAGSSNASPQCLSTCPLMLLACISFAWR